MKRFLLGFLRFLVIAVFVGFAFMAVSFAGEGAADAGYALLTTLILVLLIIYFISAKRAGGKRKREDGQSRQLESANQDINTLKGQLADKDAQLQKLLAPEAQAKTAAELEKVQTDLAETVRVYAVRANELAAMNQKVESTGKKLTTAENRIKKISDDYKSMLYAMEGYASPDFSYDALIKRFSVRLDDLYFAVRPDPHCYNYKELRARFRQNEKQIQATYESYQSRFTSKSDSTMYRFMVLALQSEFQNILRTVSSRDVDSISETIKTLIANYYAYAVDGNRLIAPVLHRFMGQIESLYIDAVSIEHDSYVLKERAKEEQRALREQMRQEAEDRKLLEQQRLQVQNEEKKYRAEIERLTAQLTAAASAEDASVLERRMEELEQQLDSVEAKKEEITKLQHGKAGTVYVISNMGAFGDSVFKVGMTRRLDPQERINELGSASVPFPFDVHSFIFSDDAVALESELHKRLNNNRVNKVNLRKEFFDINGGELQALVEQIDPTASFTLTAAAEQYRQSLSIVEVGDVVDVPEDEDDEEMGDAV